LIGVAFERLFVRPMASASRLTVAVATIGLFTLLFSLEAYFFGPSPRYIPPPLAGLGWSVFGVFVSPTQALSFAAIAAIGLGLGAFLRYTDFGLAVLAAAQDATAVRLV